MKILTFDEFINESKIQYTKTIEGVIDVDKINMKINWDGVNYFDYTNQNGTFEDFLNEPQNDHSNFSIDMTIVFSNSESKNEKYYIQFLTNIYFTSLKEFDYSLDFTILNNKQKKDLDEFINNTGDFIKSDFMNGISEAFSENNIMEEISNELESRAGILNNNKLCNEIEVFILSNLMDNINTDFR